MTTTKPDTNTILKNITLKLVPSSIPPCGGEYITSMDQITVITVVIPNDIYDAESGCISSNDKHRLILHRNIEPITESDSLCDIAINKSPISWHNAFVSAIPTFQLLDSRLAKTSIYERVVPNKVDIFSALELCPLDKVKVIIMGQDPYHTVNNNVPVAMGCSFSTRRDSNVPSSLSNIYKEIRRDYPDFKIPHHGDLTSWAKQGILLLNSSLTTIQHAPGAHIGLWNPFIFQVIRLAASKHSGLVFLLWGAKAQKLVSSILSSTKHHFLKCSHPSPFSYSFGSNSFEECGHFKTTNDILEKMKKSKIDWNSINEV